MLDEATRAARKLFLPKYPLCATQCPSCPFTQGNDVAWIAILKKVRASLGLSPKVTKRQAAYARATAYEDVTNRGDFLCHHSVYVAGEPGQRPESEYRQCPGALKIFRGEA